MSVLETIRLRLSAPVAAIAVAMLAPTAARADVPFHKIFPTNAVEVEGQEAFADWVVLVFPGGPPSGRPVAWPSLVEPGHHTVIDRKTLGTPTLWILPRAALDELAAAAKENDDKVDGPVASLLQAKGVSCGKVDIEESTTVPFATPEQWLVSYRLEDAAPGRCTMKKVRGELTGIEFKRPPSWARFAPRKKKTDAGAPASSSASPPVSAAPSTSAGPSAATPPSASASASLPATASSAAREPQVPERAKGCACSMAGDGGGGSALGSIVLAALGIMVARRRASRPERAGEAR